MDDHGRRPRSTVAGGVVITGSFAAVHKAPVAGPALLVMYVVPSGGVPKFDRTAKESGVRFVNLPQLAVDCLRGSGRTPAEGEALLDWMQANTGEWQYPSDGVSGTAVVTLASYLGHADAVVLGEVLGRVEQRPARRDV